MFIVVYFDQNKKKFFSTLKIREKITWQVFSVFCLFVCFIVVVVFLDIGP